MPPESHPLERGPAFGAADAGAGAGSSSGEGGEAEAWPMFRHDEFRSAGADVAAPTALDVRWSTEIAGPDYRSGIVSSQSELEWLRQVSAAAREENFRSAVLT